MTNESKGTLLSKYVALIAFLMTAVSCGSGGSSPASPSAAAPAAAPGTRVIAVAGSLAFGSVTVGQSASQTFTITNSGTTVLTIASLTLPTGVSGAYSASFTSGTIAPGASQSVNFRFSPTAAQDYGGTLTINGDQTSGTNTIAVSGIGVLAPGVAATRVIGVSGSLNFGDVAVGQSASQTFTITNTGNSTLTVTNMTISACSADYSANWTSGTVLPGGSQQVTVFFKPQAAQQCNATLTVVGDQTSGANTIGTTASGSGTAPTPAPSPSGGGKYDGTYDFTFQYAAPGGPKSQTNSRFLFITNGVVSSADRSITGVVDANFGSIRFTSICPYNETQATWTGVMDASARSGSNFGQGTYACANPGTALSWQARQSQ